VQFADEESSINRYYRQSLARLQEAYDTFKSEGVNFVINLGDLINSNYNSYKPVMEIIASSGIETHHLTGNHDYAVDEMIKDKLPVLLNNPSGYYSLKKNKGFRFIFLNGNEISTYAYADVSEIKKHQSYLDSLKKAGKKNAIEWNGGIGKRQLEFLEKQLKQASKNNEKVIIACHFPVFPENIHNLLNYGEVLDLINKYDNTVVWFNGHNHAGNYGIYGSAHFITFRGMVETPGINSFAIIRIYQNKIEISGYGRESNRIITF
jgi:predicted phosphodiesterase